MKDLLKQAAQAVIVALQKRTNVLALLGALAAIGVAVSPELRDVLADAVVSVAAVVDQATDLEVLPAE